MDLSDANNIIRRPISAESAIMHPSEKIIALRGRRSWLPSRGVSKLIIELRCSPTSTTSIQYVCDSPMISCALLYLRILAC